MFCKEPNTNSSFDEMLYGPERSYLDEIIEYCKQERTNFCQIMCLMFLLKSKLALGRLLDNEKAIELCHSKLIEDLSNDDSTAHGLEMVIKLKFVSDYLINLMLKCFKSDRGMIRTQICETVTVRVSIISPYPS